MTDATINCGHVRRLRLRARRLRRQARCSMVPVASALNRRASELELEAYLVEQRLRPFEFAAA
jgi:hypothetical protein